MAWLGTMPCATLLMLALGAVASCFGLGFGRAWLPLCVSRGECGVGRCCLVRQGAVRF